MTKDITAALQECVKRMVPLVGCPEFEQDPCSYVLCFGEAKRWFLVSTITGLPGAYEQIPQTLHGALCLWEHHLHEELKKRGHGIHYRPDTHRHYFTIGGKQRDDFVTLIDALMAGIEAVVTTEEAGDGD